MEISQELIEKHGLSTETVSALSEYGDGIIANEKNTLEQALKGEANKNAEGILSGYVQSIQDQFKVEIPRLDGEKVKDWAGRALPEVFKAKQGELEKLKTEYDQKLKSVSGRDVDEITKKYESEKDELLKKYADYDKFKDEAVKVENYEKELSLLKKKVAFGNVKPTFPESANPYEVAAKWSKFENEVLEKYDIEIDENGDGVYVDKENKFKTGKLSDLVAKEEAIQGLAKGRQQSGLGGKTNPTEDIEGVPFKVDKSIDVSKQIREYLVNNEKMDVTTKTYSERFSELYTKIRQKTAA